MPSTVAAPTPHVCATVTVVLVLQLCKALDMPVQCIILHCHTIHCYSWLCLSLAVHDQQRRLNLPILQERHIYFGLLQKGWVFLQAQPLA